MGKNRKVNNFYIKNNDENILRKKQEKIVIYAALAVFGALFLYSLSIYIELHFLIKECEVSTGQECEFVARVKGI